MRRGPALERGFLTGRSNAPGSPLYVRQHDPMGGHPRHRREPSKFREADARAGLARQPRLSWAWRRYLRPRPDLLDVVDQFEGCTVPARKPCAVKSAKRRRLRPGFLIAAIRASRNPAPGPCWSSRLRGSTRCAPNYLGEGARFRGCLRPLTKSISAPQLTKVEGIDRSPVGIAGARIAPRRVGAC